MAKTASAAVGRTLASERDGGRRTNGVRLSGGCGSPRLTEEVLTRGTSTFSFEMSAMPRRYIEDTC